MNEQATTFGAWLRRQRLQVDLTQLELAERLVCSVATVRKLERDELRPSKQLAERLVQAFNIPTEQQPALLAFARRLEPVPQLGHTPAYSAFSPTVQTTDLPVCHHNLLAPITPLVGRERELADLQRLLAQPDVRLVTILGAGGIGKSHLAQELARRQLDRTQAETFFVALAAVGDVESMTTAILDALGYPVQTDRRSLEQQLLDYLQPKQMLLVLDNFEHLLAGTGLVNAILRVAPGIKVVVTSRERLLLSSETLYVLHSLAYPDEATTPDLLDYAAIKLFLQRARQMQPAFAPNATDSAAMARICRLVEGMPLGILLAAAWVNQLSVQVIADEISQNLDFLASEWRDLPERHRSVRAVFDHSWRRLTDAERTIFMQLALFRGGFTRQAAQQVTGASLHQLRTLVHQSLLQVDNDERYTLHELLRQYAEAELTIAGQRAATATRHCAYYADLLAHYADDRKGPGQAALLTLMEAEHDNLRTAWAWTIAQHDGARVAQMRESLGFFYEWRGRIQEGERTFAQAVDAFALKDIPEPTAVSRLLTWQATFCYLLGKQTKAAQLLHEALKLVDRCQEIDQTAQLTRAAILHGLGQYAYATGDRQEAHRLFAESLAYYQRYSDPWGAATVRLSIQKNDRNLSSSGNPRQYQRSIEAAMSMVLESVGIFRRLGDQAHLATALDELGIALLYRGQAQEAQAALTECRAILQALGTMNGSFISTLVTLATAYEFLGLYEQARLRAQEAHRLAQAVGDTYSMRRACCVLSSVALAQQCYADVQGYFQEELRLIDELGQFRRAGTILQLVNCGLANYRCGDFTRAEQQLVEALCEGQTRHAMRGVVHGLLLGALLLVAQGKVALAVEIHALAQCYPLVANCRWCADVAGHELTVIAETLPAESVAAARARGQASDLASTIATLLVELAPHR